MNDVRAIKIECNEDAFSVLLNDGRTLTVPYICFPILDAASPSQRESVEIYANGRMLHWPKCDEDIEVAHLLSGKLPRKLHLAVM